MSLQKNKTDPKQGENVEKNLRSLNLHTPTTEILTATTPEYKISTIKEHMAQIWETMGLDMTDDSLQDTPNRIAKMFINEIYWGMLPENFPKITVVENKMSCDEMVCEKNVTVSSNCEHHGVIIDGKATVAYIPGEHVIGLSKINRVVEYFSKRPQIQERLTMQIAETLKFLLGTDNVAVSIEAVHFCVKSRGVEDQSSTTVTNALSGCFKTDPMARNEFLSIARDA
jgi:GTP cyclohydrolase I